MSISPPSTDEPSGDVVCVGLVPVGQPVDWSPGSYEPEVAEWVPDSIFLKLLAAADRVGASPFSDLDIYRQTRFSKVECRALLGRWRDVEVILEGTVAAHWAAAVAEVMRKCSGSDEAVEVLIEGP